MPDPPRSLRLPLLLFRKSVTIYPRSVPANTVQTMFYTLPLLTSAFMSWLRGAFDFPGHPNSILRDPGAV